MTTRMKSQATHGSSRTLPAVPRVAGAGARIAIAVLVVYLATTSAAFALNWKGHTLVTYKALAILKSTDTDTDAYARFMSCNGTCTDLPATSLRNYDDPDAMTEYRELAADKKLIKEVPAVDEYRDLEFVDVEGGFGNGGRDDPHKDEWNAIDDRAHYTEKGMNLTAYNHFIDIKKGPGIFDDYDGYAYKKGSASRDQYQKASDATSDWLAQLMGEISRFKVDEGIAWWLNDEYVHAPCHPWYRNCSPSVERYSFPQDKKRYATVNDELAARFPLANSTGHKGKGMPYSVFMPVDNMARYWSGRFVATKDPAALGGVLHAIQDASVPHHAAGYTGNWHGRYENALDTRIPVWLADPAFQNEVSAVVEKWSANDPAPPALLLPGDYSRTPALNWPIEHMVTWVALNAYREYSDTYEQFRNGYKFDEDSARNLTKLATAMSVLALKKANASLPESPGAVRDPAPG